MGTNFTPSIKTKIRKEDALEYHASGRKGKIEVTPTKPCATARDLSLAYTPGVADPCLEIQRDPDLSYEYTARGNLVAVISNGTAVLGLGDIGALAGKPVMEGKAVLFKKFADIDVFDIEVDAKDIDAFCHVVKGLEPTFGGINLEDIKAPECFIIEERLKKEMGIPVFHDDQHGTAIISGAALLNALALAEKDIRKVRVVVSGAGAAAVSCTNFYLALGVQRENVMLVDTKGVIYKGRTEGMNEFKQRFAVETRCRTLADAMEGADVFLGCSVKGLLSKEMVRSMAKNPVVFALANPEPEISYPDAVSVRDDLIMATGRSDYPNQVNNVLGFPFIFRGALDVRARAITEEMKMAAAHALAALARQEVSESVSRAYGGERFEFGPNYIIPKPFDARVLTWVAPAVAQAAMECGVARLKIDLGEYRERLRKMMSRDYQVMRTIYTKARSKPARIVFPEAHHPKILQACEILKQEAICEPVLIGDEKEIRALIAEWKLDELSEVAIIDAREHANLDRYADAYFKLRQRRGLSQREALKQVKTPNVCATMMLEHGEVDGMVTGLTMSYPAAIRAPLQVVRTVAGKRAGGVYILVFKKDFKFLADCTVNVNPSAEELAHIAIETAALARYFDVEPRVAMLSYSNFGDAPGESPDKVRRAVELARALEPGLVIDGEMQVDAAIIREIREESYPFSTLQDDANVLIFPNLDAANIGYKLLWRLGSAEVIGPVLLNMAKPVNVLQMGCDVNDIVNLAAVTALRAQERMKV